MATTFTSVVETLMTPSLPVILLGILIVLGAPILLHVVLASSATYTTPPVVLLLGPSQAGKTALATLLERAGSDNAAVVDGSGGGGGGSSSTSPILAPAQTHTSQTCQAVELNASTDSATRKSFRNRDDASGTHTKFLLVDTPGHGKLRNVAMGRLARATGAAADKSSSGSSNNSKKLKAVVFMVDAAAVGEHDALAPTAAYLYDVLLHLQRRASSSSSSRGKGGAVPVLIAANKMDLFTALPATMVKAQLEAELTRIRATRSKGLLDSGVGIDDVGGAGEDDQDCWLGEYGSEKFSFQQMGEFDIDVEVIGGSVTAEADVDKWWWWIAQRV
ncbi:hypothetical protein JDV02_009754 [Purpureocillium takamizusanense]|uniref:Signal recognition particle receptor subunit beta n=1 Tax=Purpureocillium takamizusanense TaxID=2060973 RepID=A0A9Q8QSL4_9HYPO|nr:uncharacterized protein JDV02_009754 [Purpureocillium takamizusanense]UNI23969.1 hypothetical protein JDV02_009754 [Purpureocillium takamizusanense]